MAGALICNIIGFVLIKNVIDLMAHKTRNKELYKYFKTYRWIEIL